jgi:hydrogenase expression/formation protein HypD
MNRAAESRRDTAPLLAEIRALAESLGEPVSFMEVCGTHTVNAARGGIHSLLPGNVRLVSGPGCPVCVTAQRHIDALIELAGRPEVVLATYGDLVRVPGRGGSLERARGEGADVRVVTSTLDAVEIARAEPEREVVFAGIGFETTAPATAVALLRARDGHVTNFSVLSCHKLVLPALRALVADPEIAIDGFLCPGHVSVIIGAGAYGEIAERHGRPCVVAGFDPDMILEGILHLLRQRAVGEARVENLYAEVVAEGGNLRALRLLEEAFLPADAAWRALGVIPRSGLDVREELASHDALRRFCVALGEDADPPGCRCGEVITGRAAPGDCPLFGEECMPAFPVGPCMVSSEGTCRAWHRYRREG